MSKNSNNTRKICIRERIELQDENYNIDICQSFSFLARVPQNKRGDSLKIINRITIATRSAR